MDAPQQSLQRGSPPPPYPASPFRRITPADDAVVASIIRAVMPEFGADGPGFAIHDPEVDGMYAAYQGAQSRYEVVVVDGVVVGGGGFAPLAGAEPGVCELRKMYLLHAARGRGLGRGLLRHLLAEAASAGFDTCYLETLTAMEAARALYVSEGFVPRAAPLGSTGHFGCDRWYERPLGPPSP